MKKTQRQKIMDYLKKHGRLNSYYATFVLYVKQAPTRIKELREDGYTIESVKKPNRSVDWILKPSIEKTTDKEMTEWIKRRMKEADRQERVDVGNEPQLGLF